MTDNSHAGQANDIDTAAALVSAYVSNNSVPVTELPGLIASVHAVLSKLRNGVDAVPDAAVEVQMPSAAQIRKSVTDAGITSFIDGRTYKTLKRHLAGHGLDPKRYRERYGLPADYPMVAPSYAAERSALAKAIGLGRPGALAQRRQGQAGGRRRTAA
ncbi:MucR family transcriptional regulator [Methylobacterium sp. P31]